MREIFFHERFMREALDLAGRGTGLVHPNPLVGAVLVRDGEIVGRGYHARCGGAHAEVNAIADARTRGISDFSGTTLYVTLEPCCHTGKTPPCTDLIISAGIGTIVAGMEDPDLRVSGKGFETLRKAGVTVVSGVLEAECRDLNKVFMTYKTRHRPYMLLKMASTLDGKTSGLAGQTNDGGEDEARWISSRESRAEVHRLRSEMTAVMCGIGTVLADDPMLDVRHVEGRNPVRIVVDSRFRTPLGSKVMRSALKQRTMIAGITPPDGAEGDETRERMNALARSGAEIVLTDGRDGRVDLAALAHALAEKEIDSVLLEGGMTLAVASLEEGIVDAVRYYIAPSLAGCGRLEDVTVRQCCGDIVIDGNVGGSLCLPA